MNKKQDLENWAETNRTLGAVFYILFAILAAIQIWLEVNLTAILIALSMLTIMCLVNYRYAELKKLIIEGVINK